MQEVKRWFEDQPLEFDQPFFTKPHLLGLFFLWVLACLLAVYGLGALPLRDFDEATVARVAFELSQKEGLERLLPTLWDAPYLNKPPGLHWLIAFAIHFSEIGRGEFFKPPSEIVIRIIPALISTLIVPVGGLIQGYLRPGDRTASFATSSILLTLLPVARHGRLAMLDGPQLTAIGILWLLFLSLDSTNMDRWRSLGAGLVCSAMLMLKAPLLLPGILAAVIPMWWGGELRKLGRSSVIIAFIFGLLPGCFWHLWHGLNRGVGALWLWSGDGAGRVLFDLGEGSDLGWRVPLIEVLEGGWPWLLFWPFAIMWAWRQRHQRWGQWALGSQLVLAMVILPLKTQLPWYSHPLWLPFALLCGVPFAWLISKNKLDRPAGFRCLQKLPLLLLALGSILTLLGLLGVVGFVIGFRPYSSIAIAVGLGWSSGAMLLTSTTKSYRLFGAINVVVGSLAGLGLLMSSSFWLWELNETWPVESVVELGLQANSPSLFLEGNEERPSLNWYLGKRVRVLNNYEGAEWILTQHPGRVIKMSADQTHNCQPIDSSGNWTILNCAPANK